MPIVFFARAKPQGADIIDLQLALDRVFLGYPAWRDDVPRNPRRLHACLIDPRMPRDEWQALRHMHTDYPRQCAANYNLVQEVQDNPESIVLVPRPDRGFVYTATVREFFLENDPPWADRYLELRMEQKLQGNGTELSHRADVAQGWTLQHPLVPFSYVAFPAWIRRSFNGRSLFGRVPGVPELGLDPVERIEQIRRGALIGAMHWTVDVEEIERRLLEWVGHEALEHLSVALLQLQHPDQSWHHVGGSGDGGVDGLGFTEDGIVCGMLQSKWEYDGGALPFQNGLAQQAQRFVFALMHPPTEHLKLPDGLIFRSRQAIAELVLRYATALPLARSLRIGHP